MCIGFQVEIDIQFNLYTWLNWTTTAVSKNMFCVSFSHAEIPLTSFSSKRDFFFFFFSFKVCTATETMFLKAKN